MPTVLQHITKLKKQLDTTTMPMKVGSFDFELDVTIWDNPHPVVSLEHAVEGTKLAIASEGWSPEGSFKEQKEDGSVVVNIRDRNAERGLTTVRTLLPEELILHPDHLTEEHLKQYFEVYDGRSRS